MKVSDYIASFLAAQGVTFVFELVGGMITHMVDSIHRQNRIRLISTQHEQAAAFAAEAAARIQGVPGVAMATSGPGATNLITGIGSCYFDSTPAVFLTGQVNRHEQRGDRPIRQLGFQETDIVGMVGPVTKAAWRVRTPEEVPELLAAAFERALSGRPGPVLLDIPMDVQYASIDAPPPSRITPKANEHQVPTAELEQMFEQLRRSSRPVILAGGGIRSAQAVGGFRDLIEAVQVPVVHSLMGVDLLPYAHPQRVGMIGSYGNRWANMTLGRSDFVLVLGSRLDIRQTGADTESFRAGRIIYHVDCDPGEINNRVQNCHPVVADLRSFFPAAVAAARATLPDAGTWDGWRDEVRQLRQASPDTAELRDIPGINPNEFMHALSQVARNAAAYVVDVGQHQMWAAQSLELEPHQRFLTSGGMGAMGFALPAAVGAALACSGDPVVLIAGDGGFQLNIQELQTVVRNRLPVKLVILDNGCHGMVRQFQQSYFEERYASTYWGYSAPDFARVAAAYGIASYTLRDPADTERSLAEFWNDPAIPALLQVAIDPFTNAYPKIAFGHPLTEMEPFAKPVAMEGT